MREPAGGPALLFSSATRTVRGAAVIGFVRAALVAALLISNPVSARCAERISLGPEAACTLIRASVRNLATAEGNQALALHLMDHGKPTPIVSTRLTELQEQIGELREALRRVRHHAPADDPYVSECLDLGFKSLAAAESLSAQIQDLVISEGGLLALPPELKSQEPEAGEKPQKPPSSNAPIRAE